MKLHFASALLFCLVATSVCGQTLPNFSTLNTNNVKVVVSANGVIGYHPSLEKGSWMPADDSAGTIFAASPWISGINAQGEVLITTQYVFTENQSWFYGPLTQNTTADSAYSETFNHVWNIKQSEINTHVAYFQSLQNGTTATLFPNGYTIPADFLSWPAHGDVSLGYDFNLAPFVDYNSDNLYNPQDGDYPIICGDECLYLIINDIGNSTIPKMGNQVEMWIYAFDTPNIPAVNNTFFTKFKFTNKSNQTFYNTRISQMNDLDIGYAFNDYSGTDVAYGALYAYTGTATDYSLSGAPSYGDIPTMESMLLLRGPLLDADLIDNANYTNVMAEALNSYGERGFGFGDGIIDNERSGLAGSVNYLNSSNPVLGEPSGSYPTGYYNLMLGKHIDGSEVLHPTTGNPVTYWAPGTSDIYNELVPDSEQFIHSDNGLPPNDVRQVGTTLPFTYEPGESNFLDLAYVFAQAEPGSGTSVETVNVTFMNTVKQFFNEDLADCQVLELPASVENLSSASSLSIYPNPASNQLNITVSESLLGENYSLYNSVGQLVLTNKIQSTQTTLDISNLAQGTYTVVLKGARKVVVVE
ncbi:MAG: hypothetical protein RLZZ71_2148 [Bacteroidota bacterium]|jgi:hypothetical protein